MAEQRMVPVELLRTFSALLQEHNNKGEDSRPVFAINEALITLGDLRKLRAIIDGPEVAPAAWVKYDVGKQPHFVPVINGHVTFDCPATEALEYEPLYLAAPSAPAPPAPDGVIEALQSLKEQVAAIVCYKLGHPGTAMAVQAAVIRLINRALAADPQPPATAQPSAVACPTARVYGTNSGHGHVWERPDGVKARCGGPLMCRECAQDLAVPHSTDKEK